MSNALGAGAPGGGGDQGGFLQWLQGLAPQAQSAIMRVMQNANPVQPAAADTLQQAPNPLNNPSPVNPALANGGPPVPPVLTQTPNAAAAIGNPHGDGPPPPPIAPIVGAGGSAGGAGASMPFPQNEQVAPPIGGGPGMAMEAPTETSQCPILGGGPGEACLRPSRRSLWLELGPRPSMSERGFPQRRGRKCRRRLQAARCLAITRQQPATRAARPGRLTWIPTIRAFSVAGR